MKLNLIETLSTDSIENIKVFRDDLYPFLGGGNKGRKIDSISEDISRQEATAIVTTGGINSNHCRVTAIYAAINNMKCTLVLHGNKQEFFAQQGNSRIMRDADADLVFVKDASEISVSMDTAMQEYTLKKEKPYYLRGGGHCLVGAKAYIEAVSELADFRQQTGWEPRYIFLASGTGSTQAGIMAGLDKYGFNKTEVIGISIARTKDYAESIIRSFYEEVCQNYNIVPNQKTIVLDDYLCGGYEQYNQDILTLSENALKNYGFILDPTYTAKAFYGMKHYLKHKNNISPVLFWHTGGLLNYLK